MKRFGPRERARKAKFKRQSAPHMKYANGRSIAVRSAAGQNWMIRAWNSAFVLNAMEIMSTCQDHLFTHEHVK